jgi:hypothetical protein
MGEVDSQAPGRLEVEVEAGKKRGLSAQRFRESLKRAVRIAKINLGANAPAQPGTGA